MVLELVVEDVSLGAALVLVDAGAELVVVAGAELVVLGADATVIGELVGALSDVEKPTVAGAPVDEVELVVVLEELLLPWAAVCVAVWTAACAAVTAVCTAGLVITGAVTTTEFSVAVISGPAITCVGTIVPRRSQFAALPAKVSELVIAVCSPVTGVLLLNVAVEALTGPPAPMLPALSARLLVPASIAPGVNVPLVARVMPPAPVALTAPPKLLVALASVIALLPACRFVVPVTASGPVCAMFPLEVRARVPALLAPSVVDELSTRLTVPVVLTTTVPKFALPCVSEIEPPPVAVSVALPPTLSTSVGWSTKVMPVPVNDALLVMTWLVPTSEIVPNALNTRLSAVLLPVIAMAESSEIDTAPGEL